MRNSVPLLCTEGVTTSSPGFALFGATMGSRESEGLPNGVASGPNHAKKVSHSNDARGLVSPMRRNPAGVGFRFELDPQGSAKARNPGLEVATPSVLKRA